MAHKPRLLFISGTFWQEHDVLGIHTISAKGAVPVVQRGVAPFYFGGQIIGEEDGILVGEMFDLHGHATLSDIDLSEDELCFSKHYDKYERNPLHQIDYLLRKQEDGSWFGTYTLEAARVGGPARCYVQEVNRDKLQQDGASFYLEWQRTRSQIGMIRP